MALDIFLADDRIVTAAPLELAEADDGTRLAGGPGIAGGIEPVGELAADDAIDGNQRVGADSRFGEASCNAPSVSSEGRRDGIGRKGIGRPVKVVTAVQMVVSGVADQDIL